MTDRENELLTSEYIVCFYDVLGQRDWMNSAFDKSGQFVAEKQIELNKIVASTRQARAIFRERIEEFAKAKEFAIQEGVDYGVQQFSDSTVIYVSLKHEWCLHIFHLLLLDVAFHSLEWHAFGLYLRGAITKGLAWHVDGGQLCGAALDEAEHMERTSAFSPRVIFSNGFVQWMERSLAEQDTPALIRDGLMCVKSMMQWEPDGECSLNILQEVMLRRLREEGNLPQFNRLYYTARKNILEALKRLSNQTAWKHLFLDDSYNIHEQLIKDYFIEKEQVEQKFGDNVPNVTVGDYYVGYFRFVPLTALPNDKKLLESGLCYLGYSSPNGYTLALLKTILEMLKAWKDKCLLSLLPNGAFGVQQISNYVMFYVRDDGINALIAFLKGFQLLQEMPLRALTYEHMTQGAVVRGKGWVMDVDCLLGPVVGDADALAVKKSAYPRVVISKYVANVIRAAQAHLTFWPDIAALHLAVEPDGELDWNVLAPNVIESMRQRGYKVFEMLFGVYTSLMQRQRIIWHFCFRTNRQGVFARQLGIYLLVFREKLRCLWGEGFLQEAVARVDEMLLKEFGIKNGDPPRVLRKYASVPDFPTREALSFRPHSEIAVSCTVK